MGAPPLAPCIRHTSRPRMAGARHHSPLRFDLAWNLNAWCHSPTVHGVDPPIFCAPYPLGGRIDVANNRLPTHHLPYVVDAAGSATRGAWQASQVDDAAAAPLDGVIDAPNDAASHYLSRALMLPAALLVEPGRPPRSMTLPPLHSTA